MLDTIKKLINENQNLAIPVAGFFILLSGYFMYLALTPEKIPPESTEGTPLEETEEYQSGEAVQAPVRETPPQEAQPAPTRQETYTPPEQPETSTYTPPQQSAGAAQQKAITWPHMVLTILSLIAGAFSVKSIFDTQTWHKKQRRDSLRKEDLNKIRNAIEIFHKQHGRYPTRYNQEFIKFLRSLQQQVKDPKEGEDSGYKGGAYGYRYDNVLKPHTLDTEKAEKDAKTYRLWCLLENKYDPEIDHFFDEKYHWVYMITPEGNTRFLP